MKIQKYTPKRTILTVKNIPDLDPKLHTMLTPEQMRARMGASKPVKVVVPTLPPVGKYGLLWQQFYDNAIASSHPEPEKMADSCLRNRENTLAIECDRHTSMMTRPVAVDPRAGFCKSRTLADKSCPFKATCGHFCKKHLPSSFV